MKTEYRDGHTVYSRKEYIQNQAGIALSGAAFWLILFLVWYFNA